MRLLRKYKQIRDQPARRLLSMPPKSTRLLLHQLPLHTPSVKLDWRLITYNTALKTLIST